MNFPNRDKDPSGKTFLIQNGLKALGFDPGPLDNWPGKQTEAAYQEFLKPDIPEDGERHVSPRGISMIMEFEGLDQPSKWPGGSSGITIGYGYDLGYVSRDEFTRDWSGLSSVAHILELTAAIGKKGPAARSIAPNFKHIKITESVARPVLERITIPKWERLTIEAYPGITRWPQPVFDAMVSMTYNRGTDTSNTDRRRELHQIRNILMQEPSSDGIREIAKLIRASKRLWIGQGLDGLLKRREKEAQLVEEGIQHLTD